MAQSSPWHQALQNAAEDLDIDVDIMAVSSHQVNCIFIPSCVTCYLIPITVLVPHANQVSRWQH